MTTTTKFNSLQRWATITAVTVTIFAVTGVLALPTVFAETNIGKHSQAEIRNACNAAGGQLLGVSDSGAYGCEVESTGALILCHKDQSCTAFLPARTRAERNRVLAILNPTLKNSPK